jgi:hypothetical protein
MTALRAAAYRAGQAVLRDYSTFGAPFLRRITSALRHIVVMGTLEVGALSNSRLAACHDPFAGGKRSRLCS